MNYSETKSYIERQLVKLGWEVRLDKAGFKKIFEFTHGNEERLGQLYYKLVGMGSQQPKREITDGTVLAAIADLKRMDAIVDKAKAEGKGVPKSRIEMDRISIDQLAKELETEVALEEKEARLAAEKFPKVEMAQNVSAPAQSGAAATSSLPRILVVDDSPTIRSAVSKALKNDFSFVQAADGEEAWNLLKSDDSIQLVVTDLIMPKLDGYELIKRIRADRTSARIAEMPVIVVTTLEETNAKLRALVAGANDFVTKSTDAVELKMRVMARYQVAKTTKAFERGMATRSAPQTPATVTSGANAAPARAAVSQNATTATAHGGNVPSRAPQPPAMPRNAAGAGAAPRNNNNSGFAATVMQSREATRPAPEPRRPLSPAAIPSTTSTVRDAFVSHGMSPLAGFIDSWKNVYTRLKKANPLTTTTLGATALIVLTVAAIFLINRPHRLAPPSATAVNSESETVAVAQGTADPSASPSSVATDLSNTPTHTNSAKSDVQPATAVKKTERRPAEAPRHSAVVAKAPEGGTSRPAEPAKTLNSEPVPDAAAQADSAQIAAHMDGGNQSVQSPAVTTGDGTASVVAGTLAGAAAGNVAGAGASSAAAAPAAPTVATAPTPKAATAVASAAPPPNVITQADLTKLIRRFEFVYEAGDIEQFLTLFSNNVETNDTFTKADLRRDYEELFKTTEYRTMTLPNVTWDMHDNKADGWGNFEVKVRKVGAKDTNTYKGSLTFHVEKVNGRLMIKRLYHGQWRAG